MTAARSYPARPQVVARNATALAVLSSDSFGVTPHIQFTAALAERLKLDLSATLLVMRQLPLWSDGPRHATLRRDVASFLAEDRRAKTQTAARRMCDSIHTALVDASGEIDLLALIRDLADTFMEEVTGLPRFAPEGTALPNIFSSNIGVAARRTLDAALRRQLEVARSLFPAEDDTRLALRVGQWVMGRDALIGTLGLTLNRHLTALQGAPLCKHPLPKVPTDTGVAVIGRISQEDTQVDGCPVGAGALVECRLDSFSQGTETERLRFFGAGAHVCIGRPLGLEFFAVVANELNRCQFGLHVVQFVRKEDDVFDIPSTFRVTKVSQTDMEK